MNWNIQKSLLSKVQPMKSLNAHVSRNFVKVFYKAKKSVWW